MKNEGNMITNWLDQHGDPEVEQFVEKNLAISEKVRLALEAKGWSKTHFAEILGKSPSEVTKWLSGTHNLTLKSIVKMEIALGVDLINLNKEKEYTYVYLGTIECQSDYEEKVNNYHSSTPEHQTSVAI